MSDYNLNGLNPRDFEHLTQALAIKEIATGVVPFGDGPDGGREATYRGKMQYPSTAAPWDGYLVIQAKFLARPSGDTKKDGDWALNQLESDLKKFIDPERNLPKPEYYLFVTNVVLTPVQDSGSKDKAYELLGLYKSQIGLKGYDVWDYDKLCRLLDTHTDVSKRYGGFIMSGDVLSKMLELLEGQQPNFLHVMSRFLQNELRADQFVKLEQAGHTADQKTSLANVFVDLPASKHPQSDPPPDENDQNTLPPGLVTEILSVGSQGLKGSSLRPEVVMVDGEPTRKPLPGRFVVVGGPGQGKSTLGQFICQLYRAAILKDRPAHTISAESQTVLRLIEKQCQTCGIDLPEARRFPVKIVLDQFATYLAKGDVDSLLGFILKRVSAAGNSECSIEDLRRWLGAYPWLVVLDGLDEVPATSNRSQVLEKINDFWTEVATLDADVIVVATTRPQGYNDDFSPRFYRHRYLSPLSPARALHYASRLTEARFGAEPDRKERVLRRLKTALGQETTSRLMRTPLQVTIMATLVDQIGQPPQERWRLFQQYYEVIYRRETERDIPASRILQQRRSDVNAIHNRVGLLLQIDSESAGNTESQISAERFGQLVRARIAEEGFEGEQLETRIGEIIEAALQRLVFLVGLQENRIGFEIRSLQEFTAAEALMDGGDEQVRERLEVIAPSAHWRNVFLFAVGKCFAERQFLRDMVVAICDQLNDPENDRLAGSTLTGSRLALDLLEDGVTREQPNYARALARIALRLLDTEQFNEHRRLAAVYNTQLSNVYQDKVLQLLQLEDKSSVASLLAYLYVHKIPWACDLLKKYWPKIVDLQGRLLITLGGAEPDEWVAQRAFELTPQLSPQHTLTRRFLRRQTLDLSEDGPAWLPGVIDISRPDLEPALRLTYHGEGTSPFELFIGSIRDHSLISLRHLPLKESGWAPFISGARLVENLSSETLSRELLWLGENYEPLRNIMRITRLPWPLIACLAISRSADDLVRLSEQVSAGRLGQSEDWIAAEERWCKHGVTNADLNNVLDENLPYDASISEKGFPFPAAIIHLSSNFKSGWEELKRVYENVGHGPTRSAIATQLADHLMYAHYDSDAVQVNIGPAELKDLLMLSNIRMFMLDALEFLSLPQPMSEDWISFFNWLGGQSYYITSPEQQWKRAGELIEIYKNNPELKDLIVILEPLTMNDSALSIPDDLLANERFVTDDQRAAALWIKLSQGNLSEPVIEQIVEQMIALLPDAINIYKISYVISNPKISFSQKESFLFKLRSRLADVHPQLVAATDNSLLKLIRARPSNIEGEDWWTRLGLPALA